MSSAFLHPFSPPARRDYLSIVRGEGALVYDSHGREYVDGLASLWYCQVGHGRPEVADAIAVQARTLGAFHTFAPYTNPPADQLCEALVERAPLPSGRVFLTCSGSEAVDSAIKLARHAQILAGHPERDLVVARSHGYHGVTYGGMSAQGIEANKAGFGPLVPRIVSVPHHDVDALERTFARHEREIAALISEPLQGAGGVHPPSSGYLERARELCTAAGAWLIHDEVVNGFGRLGAWFGSQHYGVAPDMIVFAKGVTSGYVPLGGVIVSRAMCDVLEADPDRMLRHGFTYSGHPTACAAALANIGVIESDGLIERAARVGARLRDGLTSLVERGDVAAVRGARAVWAAVVHEDDEAAAVRDRMLDRGVIARPLPGNAIAFCPPLVITDDEVDRCIAALADSVRSG